MEDLKKKIEKLIKDSEQLYSACTNNCDVCCHTEGRLTALNDVLALIKKETVVEIIEDNDVLILMVGI